MRIFLAGASGAIGRRLVPLLIRAGHEVAGTTRSPQRAAEIERAGARGVVVDVFDAAALREAVVAARADAVIHQLTDLPQTADPEAMAAARERNARIREEGTANLVAAARAAACERMVAQSIAFGYAQGPTPHAESDPLDPARPSLRVLEDLVLGLKEGIVLRYGQLYGPATWTQTPPDQMPLHVDAAAQAALLALERGRRGVYNIAEDDGAVAIGKARQDLGFDPAFRI